MKPLYLKIDGLSCYREAEEIDFSELDLFVIIGPTGSGKSTILDAIVYALFGEIPRIGSQGVKEMINLARDRAVVSLDFSVGEKSYRISRTMKRRGNSDVRLDEHDGTDYQRSLADRITDAKTEVIRILGMDADTFTKAVLLPQGEFSKFLDESPKERRETLITLLGLDVFEKMMKAANEYKSNAKAEVDSLTTRLGEDYEGISKEVLAVKEKDLEKTTESLEKTQEIQDKYLKSKAQLDRLRIASEKLELAEANKSDLMEKQGRYVGWKNKLRNARDTLVLMPILTQVRDTDVILKESTDAKKQAGLAEKAAVKALKQVEENRKLVKKEFEAIPEAEATVEKMIRLQGVQEQLLEHRERRKEYIVRQKENERDLVKVISKLENCRKQKDENKEVLENNMKLLKSNDYNTTLHNEVNQAFDVSHALATALAQSNELIEEEIGHKKKYEHLINREKMSSKQFEKMKNDHKNKYQALEERKAKLNKLKMLNVARTLRDDLCDGDSCPVCEGVYNTSSVDSISKDIGIEAAEVELETAKREYEIVTKKMNDARDEHTVVSRDKQTATEILEDTIKKKKDTLAAIEHERKKIADLIPSGNIPNDPSELMTWIAKQRSTLEKRQKEQQELQAVIAKSETEIARVVGEENNLVTTSSSLSETKGKIQEQLSNVDKLIAGLSKEIGDVDPSKELESLKKKIADIRRRSDDIDEEFRSADSDLATKRANLDAAKNTYNRARSGFTKASAEWVDHLKGSSFDSPEAVQSAFLPDSAITELEDEIKQYESKLQGAQAKIKDALKDMDGQKYNPEKMKKIEKEMDQNEELAGKLNIEQGRLRSEIKSISEKLQRSDGLRSKLNSEQERLLIFGELGTELKSDRFQAYLLEERFYDLVKGASIRLLELSNGRFAMSYRDDEIYVVDQDHAGEERRCSTLSGGETFMASLALALELSAQVQKMAGSLKLDSLFIDEGFGSLDGDSLSVVSDSIQRLQDTGRMVGVITHIDELKEDFEKQILVKPGKGTVNIELVGV